MTTMAVLGIIVGLCGGFGAVGFRYLIGFFQSNSIEVGENKNSFVQKIFSKLLVLQLLHHPSKLLHYL